MNVWYVSLCVYVGYVCDMCVEYELDVCVCM